MNFTKFQKWVHCEINKKVFRIFGFMFHSTKNYQASSSTLRIKKQGIFSVGFSILHSEGRFDV